MPHCGVLGEACAVCSPAVLLPATCAGVDNRELNLNNKLLTGEATRPVLKINDFTYRWGLVCKRGEMRLSALGCCTDAGLCWLHCKLGLGAYEATAVLPANPLPVHAYTPGCPSLLFALAPFLRPQQEPAD